MNADRVAALAEVIWETCRRDEGTISATGANVIAKALLESPAIRELLTEEREKALREAGRMAERLRQSNPINGDCSNSTLTRFQNALIAQSESVRTAILAERNEIQARRDADYMRLNAENELRRADREQP